MGFALLYPSYGAALASEAYRRFLSYGALASRPNNHRKRWMIKASATRFDPPYAVACPGGGRQAVQRTRSSLQVAPVLRQALGQGVEFG